jgi:hypothetical protein
MQTTSMPSVTPLFHIPVEIRLLSVGGDTTVRIMSDAPEVFFDFEYSRNITAAQIDPNQWILNQNGSILPDNTLGINETGTFEIQLFPNPAWAVITVSGLGPGTPFEITDLNGKKMQTGTLNETGKTDISHLSAGAYIFKAEDRQVRFIKN